MLHLEILEMLKIIARSQQTLDIARLTQNSFTRNRGMPFPNALEFLLDMRKTSLQTRLNIYFSNVKGGGTRGRGHMCPCAGISVLYDVLHGWALDPIIARADRNEREECEKHIDFLCGDLSHIIGNSIITLDMGYPSLKLLEKLQSSGLKFVARCSSQFVSEINNASMGDSVVLLKNGISVRVFKFMLPSGELETLATNLFELLESLFPELYALRWRIETAYFRLKEELCVEKFSGKTANSIRQDFWASMVLLNAVAVFQREADEAVVERQKNKSLKHKNRAKTSDLIITLRDRFIFAVLCGNPMFTETESASHKTDFPNPYKN